MKPMKYIYSLILIFISTNLFCQKIIVINQSGKNYGKAKIKIEYSDDITFSRDLKSPIYNFHKEKLPFVNDTLIIELEHPNKLYRENYFRIGNDNFYFVVNPTDSTVLKIKQDSVLYRGDNINENQFINYYYGTIIKQRNSLGNLFNDNLAIDTLINLKISNYKSDTSLLNSFIPKLDQVFIEHFSEQLKYSLINDIFTSSQYDFELLENKYSEILNSFNTNLEILKNDLVYFSALSGYLQCKRFRENKEYINHCNDLDSALNYAKDVLDYPVKEYYIAYLLGYNIWYCKKTRQNFSEQIEKFLCDSKNNDLTNKIRHIAKYYEIIE